MGARSGATMCARQDGLCASSIPMRPQAKPPNGHSRARSLRAPTATFIAATQRALTAGSTTFSGDCRELRIVVPSDPNDAQAVAGQATVTRTMNGSQASVTVTPKDRLVIGFGDFFHLRRRQPGTHRPLFRRALARRQSSRPCARSQFALGQGHARAMDRPVVPSLGLFLADPHRARRRAQRSAPVLHRAPLRLLGRDHPGGHPLWL